MKKRNILAVLLMAAVLVMALSGCGSDKAAETTAAAAQTEAVTMPLGLTEWTMDATTWSSPNGATVNLSAVPFGYTEGQSASFCVRLEGEEIANVPCQWDGTAYKASAELNAMDGYCYYVILTGADGSTAEVSVNTPTQPTDDSLINLAAALNSYCDVTMNASELTDDKLTITDGSAKVQLPQLTVAGDPVACEQVVLILSYDGEDVALEKLSVPEADASGMCTMDINGTVFSVPTDMEDDHQLSLRIEATLSNGHSVSASGGTWIYFDGGLMLAVG